MNAKKKKQILIQQLNILDEIVKWFEICKFKSTESILMKTLTPLQAKIDKINDINVTLLE